MMKGGGFFMKSGTDNPVPGRSCSKNCIKKSSKEKYDGTSDGIGRIAGAFEQ